MGDYLVVHGSTRVYDLEAAVHEAEGADGRVWTSVLGDIWCVVLGCEGTVFGDPVSLVSLILSFIFGAMYNTTKQVK